MTAVGEGVVGSARRVSVRRRAVPRLAVRGVHVFVLWGFAVAQPLFAVLADSPEFFVVRGSGTWEVVAFALGLVVVPPALLLALDGLVKIVSDRAALVVHFVLVGALVGLVTLQAFKRLADGPGVVLLLLAAVVGVLAALAYARLRPVRTFLTLLAPAPLVFAGFFLIASPVSKITFQGDVATAAVASPRSSPPVVWIVLDELPTTSLMNAEGEIDAVRYPNFARLADDSTWYRNATTVHEHTTESVPAMLTGKLPEGGALPFAADHPNNLFTLLGDEYRLEVHESATRLCPNDLCPRNDGSLGHRLEWLGRDIGWIYLHVALPEAYRDNLPEVTQTWMDFGDGVDDPAGGRFNLEVDHMVGREMDRDQTRVMDSMLARLEGDPAVLAYAHPMLPHSPWYLLPSGRRYANGARIPGLDVDTWWEDPWLVDQGWQRHLLQTGYVDRMLGRTLDRLEETGLYEDTLVVLVADHGVSFQPGERRRGATVENLADIAFVPLLMKAPGQVEERVDDRHVRTIDVLPTAADLLGLTLPADVDGRSMLAPNYRATREVRVFRRAGEAPVGRPFASVLAQRRATLRRQTALVGSGSWSELYRAGPNAGLLGRAPGELVVRDREGTSATLVRPDLLQAYDPRDGRSPSHVSGRLDGEGLESGLLPLAVSVNGRIAAVTRTYRDEDDVVRFSALVPESAFRPGANPVQVFVVSEDGGVVLERLEIDGGDG